MPCSFIGVFITMQFHMFFMSCSFIGVLNALQLHMVFNALQVQMGVYCIAVS